MDRTRMSTERNGGCGRKIGKGNLKGKLDYKAMTSHIAIRRT